VIFRTFVRRRVYWARPSESVRSDFQALCFVVVAEVGSNPVRVACVASEWQVCGRGCLGLVNICSGNKNPSGRKELRPEGRDLKLGNKRKGVTAFLLAWLHESLLLASRKECRLEPYHPYRHLWRLGRMEYRSQVRQWRLPTSLRILQQRLKIAPNGFPRSCPINTPANKCSKNHLSRPLDKRHLAPLLYNKSIGCESALPKFS